MAHPAAGKAVVKQEGDALVMEFAGGAALKLNPWDGEVFTATLVPNGPFAALAENLDPDPVACAQFQMDATGKLPASGASGGNGRGPAGFARPSKALDA